MAVGAAVPSHQRCVPGSHNIPQAQFPSAVNTPTTIDAAAATSQIITAFNKAVESKDFAALANLFVDDPNTWWRDHLALTWAFRTVQGRSAILDFLKQSAGSKDGFRLTSIAADTTSAVRTPQAFPIDPRGEIPGVRSFITLETVHGTGTGMVKLVHQEDGWKIFTLYTRLEELRGHEEGAFYRRPQGVQHGGQVGRKNWAERREAESNHQDGNDPSVLIVGAGQAGLTAAARLKALGVSSLIIDRNPRVGDNWRKRYHQLVLHDPVWYDHLPYIPFPPQWPIFTPKDKLAQFFESYAMLLELNIWTSTDLVSTAWDEAKGVWTVEVERRNGDKTEKRTFHPRHVIQATGHSGEKYMPALKGVDGFKGDLLCHSSEFPGARDNSQGKKAIVVGSCNSAHDIAQDFLEHGYDVTIVQRSSTCVWSSKGVTDIANAGVYEEGGPHVDEGDMLLHGSPSAYLKADHIIRVNKGVNELDREILDGLAKAGFKVDKGPDDAGLLIKYFQRGGGYYIDVGASKLIAEGKIKIKQGQEIDAVLPNGLRFTDGSELEADEVVFATGYQNMRTQTALMFGEDVAAKVGDVWGFNEEGEFKNIWQPCGHRGFWFHGGNLALCRFYSLPLALQIKGLEAGLYKEGDL